MVGASGIYSISEGSLCRAKPRSAMGRVDSQLEASFSDGTSVAFR